MKFFLIFLLFFIQINMSAQGLSYQVISREKINNILREKHSLVTSTYINNYNSCFVTIFKDGTALMAPPILGGDEGIFFLDVKSMEEMIASKKYPVKGIGTFWEKEKGNIEKINSNIHLYRDRLSEVLNTELVFDNNSEYLCKVSKLINERLNKRKNNNNVKEYVSIYIAELIRQKYNGKWGLFIEYTFNNYYIPYIISEDKSCDVIGSVLNELELAKYTRLNIEEIINKTGNKFYRYDKKRYILLE
ncbi:hypothetical protein MG290_08405 [Flavobacterium sp. CBA20B-1]|uniref:hypothetical protein n=1 Tax=unclassified Flavobacterium TaxID=196869 RepID=UPI002224C083|nr:MULTISPECIES: hypothetical protein [unclassified Flavobacterium]WCM40983.1 hypothetical protein MG290_08405 [Flavobacterium sp. CBA20B-1]